MRSLFLGFLLLFLSFSDTVDGQNQNYVTVNCSQGLVQGQQVNLGSDPSQLYSGTADAFTGIPYCQAPVGNLRFQDPQPLTAFNTTVHDATYYRPKCPQLGINEPTNEDCLYLNVFTPMAGNQTANLSVLVLIDGTNGFSNGGCDDSQTKGIVSNLVQRQIVVVTLQYRIGALGFFTTYTNAVQSNLGMLDQVQAMRWIKSEIVNFGGNPNQITVAGQDDGGCAVSAHTLSPMSQDLFNQAIVQSGSVYSCYNPLPAVPTNPEIVTTTPRPVPIQYGNAGYASSTTMPSSYNSASAMYDDPSQNLAQTLCNISPSEWDDGDMQNIQNCLKNYTVDFFVNQKPGGPTSTWMIVRDNQFLPDSLDNLSQRRPNIPIIIGTVQDEDADYAFKLINTGKGNDPNNLDNWIFDFARKNKLNQTMTNTVSNIISNNYGVSTGNVSQTQNQNGNWQQNVYQDQNQNQGQQNVYQNQNQGQGNVYQNQGQGNVAQTTTMPIYLNPSQNQNYQGQQNIAYTNWGYQTVQTSQGFVYQPVVAYNNNNGVQYQGQQQPQYNQGYQNQNIQGQQQYNNGVQNQNLGNQGNQQQNQYNGGYQTSQGGNQQNQYQNQQVYVPPVTTTTTTTTTTPYNNGYSYSPLNPTNFQRDQPTSQNNNNVNNFNNNGNNVNSNGVQDFSQLEKITQITSDQAVSLTTTQIQSFTQNGDQHVRVYQFTHVSDVGRNTKPDTGNNWKPVFKGQDMYFITMSETIWHNSNYTSQDRQVADQMGQRWADFVKTGQVANWQPTNGQAYNYCNLNSQSSQQTGYGQQARQVFQDQVNPICQQAQNDYAAQNNLTIPYQNVQNVQNIQRDVPSASVTPASRQPGTAVAQYSDGANGQNFHLTFQVNGFPFNG